MQIRALLRLILPALAACSFAVPAIGDESDAYTADERSHWSLLPRSSPVPPVFDRPRDAAWVANPVDAFVLRRLNQADLQPSPPAERRALARRLSFALTGLPPTPEAIAAFLGDPAPDAYERLVDRLLASPRYGEQWGQHWLDVVRYAESEGFEYDRHRPGAWRFRDYVIRSFNSDKPYDRFVLEQIAGDELPDRDEEVLIGAGFHRLGPVRRNAGNSDVAFSRNEVLTDRTDAVGLVFLGLTVGCARCHDHMFDAIRQKDYYRLQAFLAATQEHDVQLGENETIRRWNEENDRVQAEVKRLRLALDTADGEERERLSKELKAAQKSAPLPLPTISSVQNDEAQRTAIHVLHRGQTEKPLEAVGPRVLGVLLDDAATELAANISGPKTELARWIASTDHPLTARVYVNRLWSYQFGAGIVATPNDFGVNGAAPSHPELLDWLANELVASGWSTKYVQRQIVTSNTWRQGSDADNAISDAQKPESLDPNNRLLWHFPRRRLAAEELRDALLSVSGRLEARMGGPSVMPPVPEELTALLYDPEQWQVTADRREHDRRSVYLVAKRNLRLPFLDVFDQPDLQISCARRESSTHAPQALELLNGTFVNDMARAFADRLRSEAGNDRAVQVEWAFQLATGRSPTKHERALVLEFLAQDSLEELALAMFNLNSFLYVD
jgi:hypothetical protein